MMSCEKDIAVLSDVSKDHAQMQHNINRVCGSYIIIHFIPGTVGYHYAIHTNAHTIAPLHDEPPPQAF